MKRLLGSLALIGLLTLGGVAAWRVVHKPVVTTPLPLQPAPVLETPAIAAVVQGPVQTMTDCSPAGFENAAAANAVSLDTLSWGPFRGRAEIGWPTYGPRIAEEIGSDCDYDSAGFARALSLWQADHRLAADGRLTPDTFHRMRSGWDLTRPFQVAARAGCPAAPDPVTLEPAARPERYGDRAELVHPGALAAYRRMVADARAVGVAPDPALLTIFSAFRDPAADAQRCAEQGNCGGAARALCSAHRTGTALDLNLGHAPGSRPDSSEDRNRLWMSQTPTYRWLVRNAGRYGFVNYAFEPWHWEWAGAGR